MFLSSVRRHNTVVLLQGVETSLQRSDVTAERQVDVQGPLRTFHGPCGYLPEARGGRAAAGARGDRTGHDSHGGGDSV